MATAARRNYFKPTKRKFTLPTEAGRPGRYGSYSATYGGRIYHSRKEALYAAQLDQLKKAALPVDRVVSWEPQVKIPLVVNGKLVANYYLDFVVHFADLRTEWQEVKGFETNVWKLKEKLVRALYPDQIFRVIR